MIKELKPVSENGYFLPFSKIAGLGITIGCLIFCKFFTITDLQQNSRKYSKNARTTDHKICNQNVKLFNIL